MSRLPAGFTARPFAHRGLHDAAAGIPENSRAAVRAAVAAGYGVEIDIQLSADGEAMVFHDDTLERLTAEAGPIRARSAAELAAIPLEGSDETIPTLAAVLALLPPGVPALVEIKDQGDGFDSRGVGPLEARVAHLMAGASPFHAIMSRNPDSVAAFARLDPERARGLAAGGLYPGVPPARIAAMTHADSAEAIGADFVSFRQDVLPSPRSRALRAAGVAVLCWTIRGPAEAAAMAPHGDAITFEGFRP